MEKIYTSASRIVFILIAAAICAGLFTNKIDPKDFMILASMVFSFYFTKSLPDETPRA